MLQATQGDLAEIAGTNQATVSRWEKGVLHPDLPQLARIRDAVRERGLEWDDRWFFELPAAPAEEAAA
ncbi:helix-turn-helix transcriptional regulator [Acuticoccus kandeliae]|uniref:helix-turn-helix transcriptional regulator n=1 Tax=Acuticoccus kandeliae TaxID=2073160 RepID=UPI0013004D24|nr:helix-turn-helix transcriptional regulator [Acuticoccus kandeliae]